MNFFTFFHIFRSIEKFYFFILSHGFLKRLTYITFIQQFRQIKIVGTYKACAHLRSLMRGHDHARSIEIKYDMIHQPS